MQNDVVADWGEPPGTVMTVDNKFLIPGIEFGNVFVGIQPARPPLGESDLAKAAHDKTKPPHHQYIAFYFWLQEVWGADAVFHVGTHGLAEFMKLTACSISAVFFRDMFPNLIQLLNQAFTLVTGLDEPVEKNFVRKHSLENLETLKIELEKGMIDEKNSKLQTV